MTDTGRPKYVRCRASIGRGWFGRQKRLLAWDVATTSGQISENVDLDGVLGGGLFPADYWATRRAAESRCPDKGTGDWVEAGTGRHVGPSLWQPCRCGDVHELWDSEAFRYAILHLEEVEVRADGWEVLYRCSETGVTWLEDRPRSEEHGGGPMRLRQLGPSSDVSRDLTLDHDSDGHVLAVRRVDQDGITIWERLPDAGDSFVSVTESDGEVILNTWSCWRLRINAQTGAEIDRTFTK